MDTRYTIRTWLLLSLSFTLLATVCDAADWIDETEDLWDVQIGLPFWATGLDGKIGVRNRTADVDQDFSDIVDMLDLALALNAEVRYCHHWLFFVNGLYTKLSTDGEPEGLIGNVVNKVGVTIKELDLDFGVGYNLFPRQRFRLEPFVGGRVIYLESELSLALPNSKPEFSSSKGWADPIVGLMTRFPVGAPLSLFAEADIGGFGVSSDLTWQVNAGAQWDFAKHFYLRLSYRHWSTDFEDDGFKYDVSQSGPQLEIGARF